MSLYSVVHKDRKNSNRNSLLIQSNQTPDSSDSPCSIIEQHMQNYEDTESEYASELRRQTYLQKIGKSFHICLLKMYTVNPRLEVDLVLF